MTTQLPPNYPPQPDPTTNPVEYLEWFIQKERVYGSTIAAHVAALNLNALRMNHIMLAKFAVEVHEQMELL